MSCLSDRDKTGTRSGTPPGLVAAAEARWVPGGFTVDAAAQSTNAKVARYWSKIDNGLEQPWAGERVWCNPPYDDIGPWVRKAARMEAEVAVLLLPVRASRPWWHDLMRSGAFLDFLEGRVNFINPEKSYNSPAESSVLAVFRPALVVVKERNQPQRFVPKRSI